MHLHRPNLRRAALTGLLLAALAVSAALAPGLLTPSIRADDDEDPGAESPAAPDFPEGLRWWNTGEALSMERLRGQIVLLDFWTFCCINCIHILDELEVLEEKYHDDPFLVVGVHSPKFENEKDPDNIRAALLRYGIEHPVLVDSEMTLWRKYGVRSWPTLVLIDAKGRVRDWWSGEGHRDEIDAAIATLIAEGKAQGVLADAPLPLDREAIPAPESGMLFPGKVAVDGERIFVADSGHDRILVTDAAGKVADVIGRGVAGLGDGSFEAATFRDPQGMLLVDGGEKLLVADTGNHAIRSVDLTKRTVTRIAGTGSIGSKRKGTHPALTTSLNSPWALAVGPDGDDRVWIAMAGTHQIWTLTRSTGQVARFSGSGRERCTDGPHPTAAYAQPSGFATDGKVLFVADSEVSSIRSVDLADDGSAATVCGSGELFGFGDVDGKGEEARLQHPLGLAYRDGVLYVADTYNHKIKRVDPKTGAIATWVGDGSPGFKDGDAGAARFYHPGGIALAAETLWVADTNNHQLRAVSLADGATRTVPLDFSAVADRVGPRGRPRSASGPAPTDATVRTTEAELVLAPGGEIAMKIEARFPDGWKYNTLGKVAWRVRSVGAQVRLAGEGDPYERSGESKAFPVELAVVAADLRVDRPARLEVLIDYTSCQKGDEAVCLPRSRLFRIPVRVDPAAPTAEAARALVDEVAPPGD